MANTPTVYAGVYSTSETLTNKIWIDGKSIYRVVFTGTLGSPNPSFSMPSTPSTIVSAVGCFKGTSDASGIPRPGGGDNNYFTDWYYSSTNNKVTVSSGSSQAGKTFHFIVEYTKA